METQSAPAVIDSNRDPGVYLLLYGDEKGGWNFKTFEAKKGLLDALEKIGHENLHKVKVFKNAKGVDIRTKVQFVF